MMSAKTIDWVSSTLQWKDDSVAESFPDLQHNLFLLTFDNKLGLCPPNLPETKVKRVLDVGTGTGIWAIDFGDEHPEAEVIGVDLSPIQPSFVPPNVRFIIDDIHEDWDFTEPFDYVHSRMMNFSIPDWPVYLKKIYDNLTPGGWVEIQEIDVMARSDDGTLKPDSAITKWCKLLVEASVKLKQPYQSLHLFKDILSEAGFTEIVDMRFKWPINHWPKDKKYKELGVWHHENAANALESVTMAPITRAFGWTVDEVQVLLANVRKELNDTKIHGYWPICSVFGRKPLA
ncbi:unnamed protein product [Fusarium equiseti]|uniref:Methyltransferase n=1 Tax=Fusarium equiseti TaxID=61235 RepID=A0A8J2NL36_FUSEQ|nr:unnamed protein product [Fusarium equiseti]